MKKDGPKFKIAITDNKKTKEPEEIDKDGST
jgi:hypothetical protein